MVAAAGSPQPIFAHDRMPKSLDYMHVIRKHFFVLGSDTAT